MAAPDRSCGGTGKYMHSLGLELLMTTMKLYKMRSLEKLEFTLDIILNERLHCAPFTDLNDPLEGVYLSASAPYFSRQLLGKYGATSVSPCDASELHEHERFNKICSLTKSFNDIRIWSHYGDGHRGIAIEIDFGGYENDTYPVRYLDELKQYSNTFLGAPPANEVLSQKTKHWLHEDEYRVMQPDDYYYVINRISAIYLGSRVSDERKALLNKLVPNKIPIYFTRINKSTLAVEPGDLMQRSKQ